MLEAPPRSSELLNPNLLDQAVTFNKKLQKNERRLAKALANSPKQQEEDERWSRLIPVKGNHPYAVVARNRVVSGANGADTDGMDTSTDMDFTGPAGVPITAVAYLDALCPIHSQELGGGVPGDGARDASRNAGDPATTFAAGVSKAQLESLPLAQRVHALFAKGQRSVLRFQRVMHFAPAGSDPEEVIAALRGVAHLVQGCWVACSALRCGGDARREQLRELSAQVAHNRGT